MKATDTIPDDETPTNPGVPVRWWKGYIGRKHNGQGSIRPNPTEPGWVFNGAFLAGNPVAFQARNVQDLANFLRGLGWLPEDSEVIR